MIVIGSLEPRAQIPQCGEVAPTAGVGEDTRQRGSAACDMYNKCRETSESQGGVSRHPQLNSHCLGTFLGEVVSTCAQCIKHV